MMSKKVAFSNRNCCVPQCHSRASRDDVSFHQFPKENDLILVDGERVNKRNLWSTKLRLGKPVTKYMLVCSKHFKKEDYILPDVSTLKPRLKKTAIPSQNIPLRSTEDEFERQSKEKYSELRKKRHSEINSKRTINNPKMNEEEDCGTLNLQVDTSNSGEATIEAAEALLSLTQKFGGFAATASKAGCNSSVDVGVQVATADLVSARINLAKLTASELKTLTGIPTLELLNVFVEFLKNNVSSVARRKCVAVKEQIILTFMRLYLNLKFVVLSIFFNVSGTTCKSIFLDVIHNLAKLLAPCIPWCSKEEIMCNMPKCFRDNLSVRIVIDCTEVSTETSKCLTCKINMYSHYKGKQTLKFLVGVSPAGLFTFLSKGYGGRASDKAIFKQSGILEMCDPYSDTIMSDKGFLIENDCCESGIGLVRPAFLKKGRLSKDDATNSSKIASARVHVERAIQRLKIFNFLQDKIPLELIPEMDSILTVIVALANLSSPILSDDKF